MIFMDSDALIGILRGEPKVSAFLFAHTDLIYAIPTPVLFEIYYGFYYPPLSKRFQNNNEFLKRLFREEQLMLQFLTGARCFDLNLNAVKKAAEISALLDSKGKHIETMDALIAGIVLSNGFTDLMTKNKSHFENIPDLHIFDYENNEK